MSNAERYFQHLDNIVGRPEDVIRKLESTDPSLPPVWVVIYKDWPEAEMITGFTLGLSATDHPDWKYGRPELMISVESADESWPLAIGFLAEKLRGTCPFCYGETINFRTKISEESDLDAFLIFRPPFLTKEQQSVQLDGFACHIAGLYPLFHSEVQLYHELGLKQFWNLPDWDPFDFRRRPLNKPN